MLDERLPQVALSQVLVGIVNEIAELGDAQRRELTCRFAEILRPVCKAGEEAYLRGFDDGAAYRNGQITGNLR